MEKELKTGTEGPIINRPEVQDFINNRDIKPEDLHLLEELASFPKNIIIMEFHNFFNTNHERSGQELEMLMHNKRDASGKKLYEIMIRFYQKYNWATSWNLVRLLEKI